MSRYTKTQEQIKSINVAISHVLDEVSTLNNSVFQRSAYAELNGKYRVDNFDRLEKLYYHVEDKINAIVEFLDCEYVQNEKFSLKKRNE